MPHMLSGMRGVAGVGLRELLSQGLRALPHQPPAAPRGAGATAFPSVFSAFSSVSDMQAVFPLEI